MYRFLEVVNEYISYWYCIVWSCASISGVNSVATKSTPAYSIAIGQFVIIIKKVGIRLNNLDKKNETFFCDCGVSLYL